MKTIKTTSLTFCLVGLLLLSISLTQQCPLLSQIPLTATDQQIKILISNSSPSKDQLEECIKLLFERGYYEVCRHLTEQHSHLGSVLNNPISNKQTRLNNFVDVLEMPTSNIQPFIKWAQNSTHIFVNFKLSHRLDSPPCSNIKQENKIIRDVPIVNGSIEHHHITPVEEYAPDAPPQQSFKYESVCIVSHQKIFFSADFKFWRRLVSIQVKKEGLGTYTFVGEKSNEEIWRWLDHTQRRWAVWEELRNKYDGDMKKFFQLVEEDEDREVRKKKKPKRKNKQPITNNDGQKSNNNNQVQKGTFPEEL